MKNGHRTIVLWGEDLMAIQDRFKPTEEEKRKLTGLKEQKPSKMEVTAF